MSSMIQSIIINGASGLDDYITMKWHFLLFSAITAFLRIESTRFVFNLLHFSLKIIMKWHFLLKALLLQTSYT